MEAITIPGAFSDLTEAHNTASGYDEDGTTSGLQPKSVLMNVSLAATESPVSIDVMKEQKGVGHKMVGGEPEINDDQAPRLRSSRIWKTRELDLLNGKSARKPLSLLDLPIDVLKEIVREVTHTNDLTSLALCHSALHRLTIPHIYSRFDIVWPDTTTHAEPRSGVDALTYGLATLVMAEEVFGEAPHQRKNSTNRFLPNGHGRASETMIRKRRGNHYAQYTKKFSLGNGPTDWVQEYLINKEGGKMLGTLVALAVARMRSLETFVWDMPTGVLRDVWLALSSLADHEDVRPCRLQKVWMRWHDNTPANSLPTPPPPPPYLVPQPLQSTGMLQPRRVRPEDLDHVEHPSFSILPALKSLSVLDIDELAYLDEMAVLIERSASKLRELRVGIAKHALVKEWLDASDDENLQQIDYDQPTASSLTIGEKRLGGVLGVLTGLVFDLRKDKTGSRRRRDRPDQSSPAHASSNRTSPQTLSPTNQDIIASYHDPLIASSRAASPQPGVVAETQVGNVTTMPVTQPVAETLPSDTDQTEAELDVQLQLETLELERVPLNTDTLLKVLDWSKLTCLTILNCQHHENLWKALRREFSPEPKSSSRSTARRQSSFTSSKSTIPALNVEMSYPLNIKRIHTNTVSTALISFLKETLAPNSLEVLFLQENRTYATSASIESIFKGPLRRHRASLRKLLIDSSDKSVDGLPSNSNRWRRWMLNREILTFICSGKMPRLRELGMALEYRDWHFFLQHLPSVPHVRSIYIPFLADHVHGADVDPRELALQIVDIVALRPEIELCYMGIANKCFEILENKVGWEARPESHLNNATQDDTSDAEDDDALVEDDEEDEEVEEDDETESETSASDAEAEDDDETSDIVEMTNQARLRLREILFYDDKVAVFRARHGRL